MKKNNKSSITFLHTCVYQKKKKKKEMFGELNQDYIIYYIYIIIIIINRQTKTKQRKPKPKPK